MTNNIIPIGVDDIDGRLFENQYPLLHGMRYNSYMLTGSEHIAVLDAVDAESVDTWLDKVALAIPQGRTVDYLIVHHMEPDHSAGIARLLETYPDAKIVATAKAIAMLPQFCDGNTYEGRTIAVKEGDTLDLGGGEALTFYVAPMVHWPEVMVTYHAASRTLFSADAFGAFGSEQSGENPWPDEARRYFINIVGKYGTQVQSLLRKATTLDVDTIAPLHGPVLHKPLDNYINLYDTWSSYRPEMQEGVLIAYASIYGGTARVARMVADRLEAAGRTVVLADLCRGDVSEAVAQAFRMGTVVFAAVTYDASVMPAMRDFIGRLMAKGWRNRRIALIQNGSWAPTAAKVMTDLLAGCNGLEFVADPLTIRSRFAPADTPLLDTFVAAL